MKKILLLGSTGKMGTAIRTAFEADCKVVCKNSRDFDACNFKQVQKLVSDERPDIVINTVAFLGIDPCEKEPQKAMLLNTLYPKQLAELSSEVGYSLVHFSTDAVFNDVKGNFYTESDAPSPINIYGFTKHGGDCFIQELAKKFYIFRIPVLFGETKKKNQFVEKMISRVIDGQKALKISDDIVSSPSYSIDIAREAKRIINESLPYGVYHISNQGKASLYELMREIVNCLNLDVKVERASYKDFPFYGKKNTNTPIKSEKIKSLRPWREAVREYCSGLEKDLNKKESPELIVYE